MSYILDALKKADAERERERSGVPDLHAQPDLAARGARSPARGAVWGLLAGAALMGVLAVLAWPWFGTEVPALAPTLARPATPSPSQAPAPAPAPAVVAVAPTSSALPLTLPTRPVAPATAAAPMAKATPAAPPQAKAAPAPTRSKTAPALPTAQATAPPAPAPGASAAAATRVYALAELPPEIRSQWPALAVGGSVYSPKAASRIVILNGQVFREGDRPLDGLAVEQIRLKSTVLVFRGYRIELKH